MKNGKLTVAIVGMGFGSCFLPIYLKHPDVEHVIMVDTNPDQLKALADMYLLDESYYTTDFESVLQNPDVDAVHLVIPPALHAPMSVQVLNAGKHCACTIPMGMSMKELEDVIKARKASGKHYMFMETSVYTREYLYVKELYESGAMGKLQYMRCAHYQDMEGWPSYWDGFPPLAHPTHAIGPCFALAGQRPVSVFGRGSGKVRPELEKQYGAKVIDPVFQVLKNGDVVQEIPAKLLEESIAYSDPDKEYYAPDAAENKLEIPCQSDTIEIHLLCQDSFGLSYDFTVRTYEIGTNGDIAEIQPVTDYNVEVSWD